MWHYFRGMVNHYKAERVGMMLSRIFASVLSVRRRGVAVMVLIVGG